MSELTRSQFANTEDLYSAMRKRIADLESEIASLNAMLEDYSDLKRFTCWECEERLDCVFSFDIYNTYGNCLAVE